MNPKSYREEEDGFLFNVGLAAVVLGSISLVAVASLIAWLAHLVQ